MTDRERDIMMAESVLGKANSYFYPIWMEFASAYGWDGAPCSEIACCISYMAGNLQKIQISNYAAGLVAKFKNAGRFGKDPAIGAFAFFDYQDGNGFSHTGRVIDYDGYKVYTIEGNIGGKVVKRSYPKDTYYLAGYGYPNYDDKPEQIKPKEEEKPKETAKPKEEEKPVVQKKQTFSDVPPTDSGYKAIEWLASEGGVKGYKDGTYKPDQPVTRRQIAVILWRLEGKPEA